MKNPDSLDELFARYRNMVHEGFLRGGPYDPDFLTGTQALEALLLQANGPKIDKYERLYGKATCLCCGKEFVKTSVIQKHCSISCSNRMREKRYHEKNRRTTEDSRGSHELD